MYTVVKKWLTEQEKIVQNAENVKRAFRNRYILTWETGRTGEEKYIFYRLLSNSIAQNFPAVSLGKQRDFAGFCRIFVQFRVRKEFRSICIFKFPRNVVHWETAQKRGGAPWPIS